MKNRVSFSEQYFGEQLVKRLFLHFFIILLFISLIGCSSPKTEIIIGEDFLSKTLFYEADMPWVSYITEGELDSYPGTEIAIIGRDLRIIDKATGKLKSKVIKLPDKVSNEALIGLKRNGQYEIIAQGGGYGNVGLLDKDGKILWIYRPDPDLPPFSMTAGDINHDGEYEFYVATDEGLEQLNHSGQKVWKKGDWVYDVAVYDAGSKEDSFVITILHNGDIKFRDYKGNLLREMKSRIKAHDIELCSWPTPGHILIRNGRSFYILDFNGKIIFRYKLGFFSIPSEIFGIRGTAVKLFKDKKSYLAVVVKFRSSSGLSMLLVFSPEGKLVYKEMIKVTTGLVAIESPYPDGEEVLLVGDGPGVVNIYQPAHKGGQVLN